MPFCSSLLGPAILLAVCGPLAVAMAAEPTPTGRVKSLRIEACLGQWNGDSRPDGLRVFVYPLDAQGRIVQVSGRLDFTLFGEIEPSEQGNRMRMPPDFLELERKSQIVHLGDFARGPGVYEIPFTRFHPDTKRDIAAQVLLKARLNVPGQGSFDATAADILLREPSRFRDQLWLYRGQRDR